MIFSSHLLDEVQRVADSVAILHRGQMQLQGDLANILQRHQRLTLQFTESLSQPPDLPGGMDWHGEGHSWSCICNGQQAELEQAAAEHDALVSERQSVGLEDIFLAHTSSNQQ